MKLKEFLKKKITLRLRVYIGDIASWYLLPTITVSKDHGRFGNISFIWLKLLIDLEWGVP